MLRTIKKSLRPNSLFWQYTKGVSISNIDNFYTLFLGIAVIINNMKFFKVANDHESKEMPDRTGTDLDAG